MNRERTIRQARAFLDWFDKPGSPPDRNEAFEVWADSKHMGSLSRDLIRQKVEDILIRRGNQPGGS